MKLTSSLLSAPIELDDASVNSLVLENGKQFRQFVEVLQDAIEHGDDGMTLSDGLRSVPVSDTMEILSVFVPFDLNRKSLQTALQKHLEKKALSPGRLESTRGILRTLSEFLRSLAIDFPHDINLDGISIGSVLKAASIRFEETSLPLDGKILEYLRIVRELDHDKLFVFINLRSYFTDEELARLLHAVLQEKFLILLVDDCAKPLLPDERRVVSDSDLCEIRPSVREMDGASLPEI